MVETSFLDKKIKGEQIRGISTVGRLKEGLFFFHFGYGIKPFVFEVDIVFESGRVRIGNGVFEESRTIESPYYEGFYSLVPCGKKNFFRKTGYFSGMVQNCVDFLNGKARLLSPIEEGIEDIRIIEEISRKLVL